MREFEEYKYRSLDPEHFAAEKGAEDEDDVSTVFEMYLSEEDTASSQSLTKSRSSKLKTHSRCMSTPVKGPILTARSTKSKESARLQRYNDLTAEVSREERKDQLAREIEKALRKKERHQAKQDAEEARIEAEVQKRLRLREEKEARRETRRREKERDEVESVVSSRRPRGIDYEKEKEHRVSSDRYMKKCGIDSMMLAGFQVGSSSDSLEVSQALSSYF
ncbi:unnamed protein product [Ambrosiozyma monospora]|uniref:Unnamed protein product n=1 Tax=Ambrosiozyma monospora TaxID=43982 RepID=A0ACB5TJR8_AMBMO|nr:unnamed protein product [Ambrosiozyma monospora]